MGFKGKIVIHLPLCEYWRIPFEVLNQTCKSEHHFLINKIQERITEALNNLKFYSTANPKPPIRQSDNA